MTDTREALDAAFEVLARKHAELIWDMHYAAQYQPALLPEACTAINRWEAAHAEEWNRVKPWFEKRLPTWREDHAARMEERFSEKQLP